MSLAEDGRDVDGYIEDRLEVLRSSCDVFFLLRDFSLLERGGNLGIGEVGKRDFFVLVGHDENSFRCLLLPLVPIRFAGLRHGE